MIATSLNYSFKETERMMSEDIYMVAIVIVFVYLYMAWYLGSIFLATTSIINIVMSIPITLVIYNYIFFISYFGSTHMSAFIIIIGIGADDIFVFHDFWQTTFSIKAFDNKPLLRVAYTFRQASRAMLVTSLTSSIAFLSCAMTPIMPLKAFGYFATILVPICFLITILVQPVCYYIYELTLLNFKVMEFKEAYFRYKRQYILIQEIQAVQMLANYESVNNKMDGGKAGSGDNSNAQLRLRAK